MFCLFFYKKKTLSFGHFFYFLRPEFRSLYEIFLGVKFLFSIEKLNLYYNTPDGRDQTDFGPGVNLAIANTFSPLLSSPSFAFDPLWGNSQG